MERPRSSSSLKNDPEKEGNIKLEGKGTYIKVMGESSVLVWKNGKSQRTILHAPV